MYNTKIMNKFRHKITGFLLAGILFFSFSLGVGFASDKALEVALKFSRMNKGVYILLDDTGETARVVIKRNKNVLGSHW